jgi:hypothetical protein
VSSTSEPAEATSTGEPASTGEAADTGEDGSVEVVRKPSSKPVNTTPASVDFLTGDFTFVYVKVAGIEAALEPKKTLELKPGTHKVELRKSPSEPWTKAGTIKVEPGKRYKVRMTKPAGLKLEAVG